MSEDATRVLIAGAPGNQGGAVVDHLLTADEAFDIRGPTATRTATRRGKLADRGVTVVEGDLNEYSFPRSLCPVCFWFRPVPTDRTAPGGGGVAPVGG